MCPLQDRRGSAGDPSELSPHLTRNRPIVTFPDFITVLYGRIVLRGRD